MRNRIFYWAEDALNWVEARVQLRVSDWAANTLAQTRSLRTQEIVDTVALKSRDRCCVAS